MRVFTRLISVCIALLWIVAYFGHAANIYSFWNIIFSLAPTGYPGPYVRDLIVSEGFLDVLCITHTHSKTWLSVAPSDLDLLYAHLTLWRWDDKERNLAKVYYLA